MNKIYDIIPNFLPLNVFEPLYNKVFHENFPWHYSESVVHPDYNDDYGLFYNNLYFHYGNKPDLVSEFFHEVAGPIIGRLGFERFIRIKINNYHRTESHRIHQFHTDQDEPHKICLYSFNNCNGYTELQDGTKLESIANRAVIFDGSIEHRSVTQTDVHRRINMNVVFV